MQGTSIIKWNINPVCWAPGTLRALFFSVTTDHSVKTKQKPPSRWHTVCQALCKSLGRKRRAKERRASAASHLQATISRLTQKSQVLASPKLLIIQTILKQSVTSLQSPITSYKPWTKADFPLVNPTWIKKKKKRYYFARRALGKWVNNVVKWQRNLLTLDCLVSPMATRTTQWRRWRPLAQKQNNSSWVGLIHGLLEVLYLRPLNATGFSQSSVTVKIRMSSHISEYLQEVDLPAVENHALYLNVYCYFCISLFLQVLSLLLPRGPELCGRNPSHIKTAAFPWKHWCVHMNTFLGIRNTMGPILTH